MLNRIQQAKSLFDNKEYKKAKHLILEIINDGDGNFKLYSKLGDVSIKLNQFNNARKHYQQSMTMNPSNPLIYIKLGNLLHQHLNDNKAAAIMYTKCIKLDPNNELCWFNFGKLWFKQNDIQKAEECYLKCKTERACVNYHYSLLLLSKSSQTEHNKHKALDLLARATTLQPNICKYHHEYAVCLQKCKLFNQANKAFEMALKLSNYKDIIILYDYSMYLSQCLHDYQSAATYLKDALALDTNNKYPYIQQEYDAVINNIQLRSESIQNQHDTAIKLLIYGFDEVITYWSVDENIHELNQMRKIKIINDIFGGYDRVHRLCQHFEKVLLSPNNIKISILSSHNPNIIIKLLKMAKMYHFFANSDIIRINNNLDHIINLSNIYNLEISTDVLLIHNDGKTIESISNHCKTYHVFSQHTMNGLTLKHMEQIERIIGFDQVSPSVSNQHPKWLYALNPEIYKSIKREIGTMNHNDCIDALPVIQWIHKNWKNYQYRDDFLLFADQYRTIRQCKIKKNNWTAANILPDMIHRIETDYELCRRYARSLTYLGHMKQAQYYYELIVNVATNNNFMIWVDYAYFLFRFEKYVEAEIYFVKALGGMNKHSNISETYLGYARTLECLEQPKKADLYFRKALGQNDQIAIMHFHYGCFLMKQERYNEAKHELQTAISLQPQSAMNHYMLSKLLYRFKEWEQYEYCLNKALELDQYLMDAKIDRDRYYRENRTDRSCEYKENDVHSEEKQTVDCRVDNIGKENPSTLSNMNMSENDEIVNNAYCVEFDRFWFDGIGIITLEFNKYYDNFVANNMNDIRCPLFDENIHSKLQTVIGVDSLQNLQFLMTNIQELQEEHRAFINTLNTMKLKDYYPIFAHNAVFTVESVQYHIKSEDVLVTMIESYNHYHRNDTQQFNINDSSMIQSIWNSLQKL